MKARSTLVSSVLAVATLLSLSSNSEAQLVVKNPNDHPPYRVELEPHGDVVLWHRYYGYRFGRNYDGVGEPEFGAGFRASIKLADPAFIPKLNNTVAISFGFDITNCQYCPSSRQFSIYTPVTLQWNFFLTPKWSTFADLGIMPRTIGFYHDVFFDFMAELGGRFHFNDTVSLTMRIGYPFISVGASFFLGS
jgi:hypothetical protein